MSSTAPAQSRIARAVSIVGHPLLLLPFSILLLTADGGAGAGRLARLALGFAMFALLVMAYSWWQVRRQRWAHIDASHHGERRSLNRFLLLALAMAAPLAWQGGFRELALGLALAAAMIAVAMSTARWWTLSLHVAFAAFAAILLLRADAWLGGMGLAFSALLAWSRLRLARHAPRDLVAGAVAGLLAGVAFWQASAALGG